MPNSSSSKYVKRRRHRHTKSRSHAKKYTIKKVMRGCSSKQYGGATLGSSNMGVELSVAQGTTPHQAATQANMAKLVIDLQNTAAGQGNPAPFTHSSTQNFTAVGGKQSGGYKSKHRRHRYKKSIGRRGRSRRFRGSRK